MFSASTCHDVVAWFLSPPSMPWCFQQAFCCQLTCWVLPCQAARFWVREAQFCSSNLTATQSPGSCTVFLHTPHGMPCGLCKETVEQSKQQPAYVLCTTSPTSCRVAQWGSMPEILHARAWRLPHCCKTTSRDRWFMGCWHNSAIALYFLDHVCTWWQLCPDVLSLEFYWIIYEG